MKAKVITIGNQKGGVGKTTLSILICNYLSKKNDLMVVDFDFQGSLVGLWEEQSEQFENDPPYQVLQKSLSEANEVVTFVNSLEDCFIFYDMPGKIDDNNLLPLYENTDLLIIPFSYDQIAFESTMIFVQVAKELNPNIEMVFIPNRIKSNVKFKTESQVNEILEQYGDILEKIPERVCFQRLSVFGNTQEMENICEATFKQLEEKLQ